MKKHVMTIVAVLVGLFVNAQVSVWDGTAEIWTHGSGTQDDPYLIESAQNLAYLAEMTNETLFGYNKYMYADTCFLLTVDLDLGSDNGLEWEPIAQNGTDNMTRVFSGNFDGGGHVISNMKLKNQDGTIFMGLFGHVENCNIKNISTDGNDMIVPEFNLSGIPGSLGVLIGYGQNVAIENCNNNINVFWSYVSFEMGGAVGGLFGRLYNSSIVDCQNNGDVSVPEANAMYSGTTYGGVGGVLFGCTVERCSNKANISIHSGNNYAEGMAVCGGIAGRMSGEIINCYNIGDFSINVENEMGNIAKIAGGVVGGGVSGNTLTISGCYSVSSITINDDVKSVSKGGIVGSASGQITVTNSYYLNNVEDNGYGIPKSEPEMKTQDFVDLLNSGSNVYAMDLLSVNNGFPIFSRYTGISEKESARNITVYPNPANDIIQIELSDNSSCESVVIYSIDGRLVETFPETSHPTTIDISNLNAGIYIMKVRLSDGNEYSKKIVKE